MDKPPVGYDPSRYRVVHNTDCESVYMDETGIHKDWQIERYDSRWGWSWLTAYDSEQEAKKALQNAFGPPLNNPPMPA